MKRTLILLCLLAGCSDHYIERAEQGFTGRKVTTLSGAAEAARGLSDRYIDAARSTRTTQDVASLIVFTSAFSVVSGAVGSASDAALARRALIGAGAQQSATRLAPRTAIAAIFMGARRLNCVATAASMGAALDLSPRQRDAAVAATIGSIDHIRILTREGLVRDVADFNGLLTSFTDATKAATEARAAGLRAYLDLPGVDQPELVLDQYLQLLAKCTEENGTTVLGAVPKPS